MLTYAYMFNLTCVSGFISYSKGKCPDPFSISNLPCGHEQVIKKLLVAEVPSIKQDDWTSSLKQHSRMERT